MRRIILPWIFLCLLLTFEGPSTAQASGEKTIEIMSYNVENLFDTEHDEGKIDWTFLSSDHPEKEEGCSQVAGSFYRKECYDVNWTESKLNLKLNQIRDMVSKDRQQIPDILAVYEIENDNILKKLANRLGYSHSLITDSPDARGIDVALLYNSHQQLKKIAHHEYNVEKLGVLNKKTRNILEVIFLVDNKFPLSVFVNHWPSQAGPTAERLSISKFLASKIKERLKNPEHRVIALGDFNTLPTERPNPISTVLTSKGSPLMLDLHDEYYKNLPPEERVELPLGSHFYHINKTWNLLDKMLVSQNLLTSSKSEGPRVLLKSFEIYSPSFSTILFEGLLEDSGDKKTQLIPKRYNFMTDDKDEAGYSDHFPLRINLAY